MQNIKVSIIVIVFVNFPVIFFIGYHLLFLTVWLWLPAAYPTLCCYNLSGFDGCILGCVTLATHSYLSVALYEFEYIHKYLKRQRFFLFLGAYNGDIPVHMKSCKLKGCEVWGKWLGQNNPRVKAKKPCWGKKHKNLDLLEPASLLISRILSSGPR